MASRGVGSPGALRRLFLVTSPGLERSLERELQLLGVPGQFETLHGGVAVHGLAETMWRCTLQSRLAELVLLRLGDPFHAPDVRSLDAGLQRLPWHHYLRLGAMTPIIKVSSEKSRLYHTKLIEERVADSIRAAANLQEQEVASPSGAAELPEVRLRLRHNEAQVSVAASGLLHKRGARKAIGDASMRETYAAACVLASPMLRRLTAAAHHDEELVLWDPFCGSGAILLEALEIALGQAPGGPFSKYHPFKSLPCHDAQEYERVAKSIQPEPNASISKLTLLGSDQSEEQIQRSQSNLRRCLRRLQIPSIQSVREAKGKASSREELLEALPCRVQLVQGSISKVVKRLQGRPTMIVTNVPFGLASGGKQDREWGLPEASDTYGQLGRLLRQQRADWRGVYCLAAFPDSFRTHTGLDWSSELRFLSGSRWVDLLSWSGSVRQARKG